MQTTEASSHYSNLEYMKVDELLKNINNEDKTVALAVEKAIPQITNVIELIISKIKNSNGRLFYIGSGTSGRLGVVDASECPPTFGVHFDKVIGIIAGGDGAIRKAVENAEDDTQQGWKDLLRFNIGVNDVVIGIAASGKTPYVIGALEQCNKHHIRTACIVCNTNSLVAQTAQLPIEVVVGPEFITGSTRMKAGTAQKMVLNMISTSVMIQLGKIKGNQMVDMQLTNDKLLDRGVKMLMNFLNITQYNIAKELLLKHGSVRAVINNLK